MTVPADYAPALLRAVLRVAVAHHGSERAALRAGGLKRRPTSIGAVIAFAWASDVWWFLDADGNAEAAMANHDSAADDARAVVAKLRRNQVGTFALRDLYRLMKWPKDRCVEAVATLESLGSIEREPAPLRTTRGRPRSPVYRVT
jgi:hypothetical protein